jgi:hypothetical protein
VVTFFAAKWACLSVQKYTLAYVCLEVAFASLVVFAGSVAKGALRAEELDCALAFAHDAFLVTQLVEYGFAD